MLGFGFLDDHVVVVVEVGSEMLCETLIRTCSRVQAFSPVLRCAFCAC